MSSEEIEYDTYEKRLIAKWLHGEISLLDLDVALRNHGKAYITRAKK